MTDPATRAAMSGGNEPLCIAAYTDGGVWISHDRVSAFVSGRDESVRELAYHGLQIVSRNARIFSHAQGAVRIAREEAGEWLPVDLSRAYVDPRRLETEPDGGPRCVCTADGRALLLRVIAPGRGMRLRVTVPKDGRVTAVQGERLWDDAVLDGSALRVACRDRLFLHAWVRREGPYAGDFLLPEVWRRRIFLNPPRSGRATSADLRPEWRDADPCIYDATVYTAFMCRDGAWESLDDCWRWTGPPREAFHTEEIRIQFSDTPFEGSGIPSSQSPVETRVWAQSGARQARQSGVPELRLPGYPSVERFFSLAPSIVDSCTVREHGMPRASHGAYYWLWAWDGLVAAAEYPRWGALDAMRDVITFVHRHRDVDGRIPMRWTRALEALDTPERGALEFLLLNAALEHTGQSGDTELLHELYPAARIHFQEMAAASDTRGFFPGLGFYPDLPEKFGRLPRSAVAMEVAAHAGFCLALAEAADLLGDGSMHERALSQAARITENFREVFLHTGPSDPIFPADCIDLDTGALSTSRPLFTLLCLQRPGTAALFGDRISGMARTLESHFLTPYGIAMLPRDDRNRGSESATGAWYPHWDLYAIRLWRAAARTAPIMVWLDRAEETLTRLGYCPEFLDLAPFERGDTETWTRHGAASNINGVTAWYRALLEGVCGLLLDGGRLRVSPEGPLVSGAAVTGLVHRGSRWDVLVQGTGSVARLEVDGTHLEGLEVPSVYFDGRTHTLRIVCAGSVV